MFFLLCKCILIPSTGGMTPERMARAMIKALVEYIGKNGRTIVKGFSSLEEANKFTERLDERISKGTCGGYIMTVLG